MRRGSVRGPGWVVLGVALGVVWAGLTIGSERPMAQAASPDTGYSAPGYSGYARPWYVVPVVGRGWYLNPYDRPGYPQPRAATATPSPTATVQPTNTPNPVATPTPKAYPKPKR